VKLWYHLARFDCPGCGQRLAVERGQVRRQERVTCHHCNVDLLLAPRGVGVVAQPDWNTGERATVVELRV
jgi:transposase-like protein